MLLQAAKDFNIDLSLSYMIGDSDNDSIAGISAECKVIQIDTNVSILDAVNAIIDNKTKEVVTIKQICPNCYKHITKYGVLECPNCKTKLSWRVTPRVIRKF